MEARQKVQVLEEQEKQLRAQVALYTDKYEEFQQTLSKSNEVFQSFKSEMEKVSVFLFVIFYGRVYAQLHLHTYSAGSNGFNDKCMLTKADKLVSYDACNGSSRFVTISR